LAYFIAHGFARLWTTVSGAFFKAVDTSTAPNRVRYQCDFTPDCNSLSAPRGTLVIRRKLVNNTGVTLTSLRARIMDFTRLNSPGYDNPAQCDLRAISSAGDSDVRLTSGAIVPVKGTTLEEPPGQPNGGGYNSTYVIPLPPGACLLAVRLTCSLC